MRVAALYDVHGNLPALEAVLADVDRESVDRMLVGGDLVWGPMPGECLERLEALGERVTFIRGNTERDVIEPAPDQSDASRWCAERLTAEQHVRVAAWAATVSSRIDGLGTVLFCHGSPRTDNEILTVASDGVRVAAALAGVDEAVVVCGHTHHQFDRVIGGKRLVNAGSVGLPYEGRAGAFWALLGPDIELRRTEYDAAAAVERLVATGFPGGAELFQSSLIEPIPRDEAVAYFEERAAKGAG